MGFAEPGLWLKLGPQVLEIFVGMVETGKTKSFQIGTQFSTLQQKDAWMLFLIFQEICLNKPNQNKYIYPETTTNLITMYFPDFLILCSQKKMGGMNIEPNLLVLPWQYVKIFSKLGIERNILYLIINLKNLQQISLLMDK